MPDTIILRVTRPEAHRLQAAINAEIGQLAAECAFAKREGDMTKTRNLGQDIELLKNVLEEITRALKRTYLKEAA